MLPIPRVFVSFLLLIFLVVLTACAGNSSAQPQPTAPAVATADTKLAVALATVAAVLPPNLAATETAKVHWLATAVAGTLTAQPTNIPTETPVPTPTATPTVTPMPMATDTPLPTNTPISSATDTPLPTSTPTSNATATYAFNATRAAATAVAPNLDPANVRINPVDNAVYLRVPSGEFMMGSDNGESSEKPAHKVDLDEFWIMRTEVTNAQYKKCVEATICTKPNNDSWDKPERANYPVTDVDWQQARTYAQWAGGRLPTEAEWEKAACGTDGRTYPWGNDEPIDQLLNYNGQIGHTTEVGTYPKGASPYGVLDMAGNVWEWTADWYAANYYASAPLQNPQGPATGVYRVVRCVVPKSARRAVRRPQRQPPGLSV